MVLDPQREPMCPVHPSSGGMGGLTHRSISGTGSHGSGSAHSRCRMAGAPLSPCCAPPPPTGGMDPRVSHRACEPWFGETWFFEKGCTSRAPPYPVELMTAGPDEESKGELADAAASILMRILYGARMGRWDLLKAVASLATYLNQMDDALWSSLFFRTTATP